MITLVQSKSVSSTGLQFSQTATLSSVGTEGNLIVATGLFAAGTSKPFVSVSDTEFNGYTTFGVVLNTGQGFMTWLAFCPFATTGTATVSANYSELVTAPSLGISEFNSSTGWGNAVFSDGYDMVNNSFGVNMTSGPLTTTNANDLLIASCLHGVNVTTNLTSSFTQPAVNSTVVSAVASNSFMLVGSTLSIGTSGDTYQVTVLTGSTGVTIKNLGTGTTLAAGTIPNAALVTLVPVPPVITPDWSFVMQQTPYFSIAWKAVNATGAYAFSSGQPNSAQWASVIWALRTAPASSGDGSPIVLSISPSALIAASFPEVYPNRIPEDVYDSLAGQPEFVFQQFGPSPTNTN